MKILTWNCNGAFRKKFPLLSGYDADILVIQECEDPYQSKDQAYQTFAANYLWHGKSKNKGLGVFAKRDISLKFIDLNLEPLELFLPCVVQDKFPLLATWTKRANSPNFGYIGQLWKFLLQHKLFLDNSLAMLVGDLNSNKRWDEWDRWWNHTDVVRELSDLGLNSAYHSFFSEAQGDETRPTLYMHRNQLNGYHIDYGFFGSQWQVRLVEVGDPVYWLRFSDHMPIMFEINLNPQTI